MVECPEIEAIYKMIRESLQCFLSLLCCLRNRVTKIDFIFSRIIDRLQIKCCSNYTDNDGCDSIKLLSAFGAFWAVIPFFRFLFSILSTFLYFSTKTLQEICLHKFIKKRMFGSQIIRVSRPDTKKPNKRGIGKATNLNTNMPLTQTHTHIKTYEPANTKKSIHIICYGCKQKIWNIHMYTEMIFGVKERCAIVWTRSNMNEKNHLHYKQEEAKQSNAYSIGKPTIEKMNRKKSKISIDCKWCVCI